MKVTINLTPAQVAGIKEYLKEVDNIDNPTNEDVKSEVNGIVQSYFQAPKSSLTDYIQKHEARQIANNL